jgi:hypothetical protein
MGRNKLGRIDRKAIIFSHKIFCLAVFSTVFGRMPASAQAAPAVPDWVQNLEQAYPSRDWIAATASGSNQDRAEAVKALARAFRTARGDNYTHLLNASFDLSSAEMGPNQRYHYVRWNLVVYIEDQDGMEVYSSTENGREGHASESEARLRSLRKIEDSIKENEFAHEFNGYLASLLK